MQDTIPIIRDVVPLESKSPPKTTTSSKNSTPIIIEVPKPVEKESTPTSHKPTKSVIKQAPSPQTEEYVPQIEDKPDVAVGKEEAFEATAILGGILMVVIVILMIWIPIKIHESARPGTRPQLWIMILLFFFFFPAWLIILIFTKR